MTGDQETGTANDEAFDWDDENESHIWERHKLTRDDAEDAYSDPNAITVQAHRGADGERRWGCIGENATEEVLLVIYTRRNAKVRVVTARRATREERKQYYSGR